MVANSRHSSNESSYFTINSLFLAEANPETRALHRLISTGIIAFVPSVKENRVFPVDLLGVVW